jgi:hypothetical protein
LEIDAASLLPADDSGYGFDNIGDVLTVSPVLLEKYLSAAATISRQAIGDRALAPTSTEFSIPPATVQTERESRDLPIGSRGGIAVHHHFPVDAEYVIKVRLQRGKDATTIVGMSDERRLDIRLDGRRIRQFTIGGPGPIRDDDLEARVPVTAGLHLVAATFVKDTVKQEGVLNRAGDTAFFEGVGTVSVAGPYNATGSGDSATRRKIFTCRPRGADDESCATTIVTTLAHRAYRRPIAREEVPSLMAPYRLGHERGGFENGIRLALQRILVSPDFLFRVEADPPGVRSGAAYRISDVELASRLSFSYGAAARMTSCWPSPSAAGYAIARCWTARSRGCSPIRAQRRSCRTSSASGCICATWKRCCRIRRRFRTSTKTSAPRLARKPSSSSRA